MKIIQAIQIKILSLVVKFLEWTIGKHPSCEACLEVKFQLTKDTFENDFLPLYSDFGIEVNSETELFQIAVPLPYLVPFPTGRTLTFSQEDSSVLSIIFRDYERMVDIDPLGSTAHKNFVKYSYIEILSVNSDKIWEEQLDIALGYVNVAVRAYTTLSQDLSIYPVNLRMLGAMALGRTVRYGDWDKTMNLYILPNVNKIPYTKDYISEENFAEIARLTYIDVSGINGFVAIHEILKSALRENRSGKYAEAILLLNVFFEVFTKEIIKNIYLEESKTTTEVDRILEAGYKNLRNHHLLRKLHIDENHQWNQNYLKFIYGLRNKIAHTGYLPKKNEVDRAFFHADIYRRFLIKKVHRTQYSYLKRLLSLRGRKLR